jgi:hypothetical protein
MIRIQATASFSSSSRHFSDMTIFLGHGKVEVSDAACHRGGLDESPVENGKLQEHVPKNMGTE